ncbi:Uncharacterised protein [Vibrio cholerae]|nr:Uncharacterised protein [Vibrio cholerae]
MLVFHYVHRFIQCFLGWVRLNTGKFNPLMFT